MKPYRLPRRVVALVVFLVLAPLVLAVMLRIQAGDVSVPLAASLFVLSLVTWQMGGILLWRSSRRRSPGSEGVGELGDSERRLRRVTIGTALEILAVILLDSTFDLRVGLGLLTLGLLWIVVWLPRRLRAAEVVTSIDVRRSIGDIFEFTSNVNNMPRYIPQAQLPEAVEVPLRVGNVYRVRYNYADGHAPLEWDERVAVYEPNRRFGTVVVNDVRAGSGLAEFTEIDRVTRITYTYRWQYTVWSALAGAVFRRAALVQRLRRRRTEWMQKLKALLEADEPGAV